ncbi:tetratricopeptide repeat protein [Streptomyces sp. HUAS TT20]|uniref:tetratricopeptide repeat protein n=1 Tax=Streptomyces sp. HUAS TT20 TaxID=3447509 RepID=UPI0021DA7244|nr:tetratricopeptide repeat protein [Streptomyces sp. HUAS 15-9]UXY29231.1 tetratricopeptide repeat protein [Streptomyces sp. HUAS 15-9]
MSRLSREKKREQQRAAFPAEPVDVRVSGTGGASVAGEPVVAGPGEEIQQAVLNHLQRLVLAAGRPILASVHDARIGYVVPLQVEADGSSRFAGEPLRMAPLPERAAPSAERVAPLVERVAPLPERVASLRERLASDRPTRLPRPADEPVRDAVPTFPLRAVPEAAVTGEPVAPGIVQMPTGVFGPPPVMTTEPGPVAVPEPMARPEPVAVPEPMALPEPVALPEPDAQPKAVVGSPAAKPPASDYVTDPDPDPKPTPARGFDAVAEEVLGDGPVTTTEEGAALLTEPMTRINEAVKAGRIDAAAELAQRTVAEASALLGQDHPEVLHLRELTAYIAYLAGDPLRAFRLSLDLARLRRQAHDAEGAYGNVQSAAAAWRAVRDPEQGLSLGRELIALWTELTAEEGPAADDIEELESAHNRMGRLTERAGRVAHPGNV